jgi:hypothetical protein
LSPLAATGLGSFMAIQGLWSVVADRDRRLYARRLRGICW